MLGVSQSDKGEPLRMNKYRAKKTVVDGITFDSKAEARRYGELKLLVKSNQICHLELQPRYDIIVQGHKICFYKADFRYQIGMEDGGDVVVEDVKGMLTPVYRLKKKLVKACHGVDIVEVK